jgi:outer membrane protein assembly factor BamB
MTRVQSWLAVVAFAILPAFAARADFTFVHCSDIHIGAENNDKTDARLFAEIAALPNKPAFVVNTGDLCEYGTDEQYALYNDVLKSLRDVKMYPAPGNHDVRWNPRGKEGYTRGTGGPLYRSWDHENVHFVTLDSTVLLEHWGHISRQSLNWLAADLKKVGPDKPVVIGFHHWIGRESIQVDNEAALFEVVRPYNVVLWLQGHGHDDIEWNVNGTPATMVKGLYQGSYDLIEVTSDEMRISKRYIPDPKKKPTDELLRDKSIPDEKAGVATRPLMTIPLKKRPEPGLGAGADLDGDWIRMAAHVLVPGARLEYRVNTEKPRPMNNGVASVPIQGMTPGKHVVTIIATLPDGRAYQRPYTITLPGVTPAWSVDVGGEVQSKVVRDDDMLLVSSMGNDFVALDASTGKERYRVKTGGPIFSACHVDAGVAYFGSADHFVYAVDKSTGKLKWKKELGGAVLAGPSVAQGVLCVGTTDTKIYGLDAATGDVRWTVPGGNMFQSKTATDGDRFFVGGWDNHFRAIDAKTGSVAWDLTPGRKQRFDNFSAYAPAITAPAVGNGKVYVSTNDGILHALSIADGSEAWRVDWKKMGYSSPLFHNGRVYCALSDEGKVFCVDANTGEFKWTTSTGPGATPKGWEIYDSSFCIDASGEHVAIANVNGTLNCLRAEDGKIAWRYRLAPGHLLGSPAADADHVYMGSMSGQVVAVPIRPPTARAER